MNKNITHLSQLKELHQNIGDHPGNCPTQRWELCGRIQQAENLLEDVGADAPGTNQKAFASHQRFDLQRMGRTLSCLALALVMFLFAGAAWLARDYVRPETSAAFAGTAMVTSVAATMFGARSADYHRVVQLFDSVDQFEPRTNETPLEVAFEDEDEWVWVYEDEAPAKAPIFNAGLQVPVLTV
ncbi:MAG: hypothetical protein ACPGVU_06205 [Limisphaerales bacterium]